MKYTAGQRVHGFRVLRAGDNREAGGNAVMLEHERTGAKVFWLDNGAENMVFSITFRTPPEDSTGVFHILEHSVLCGSGRYPMKEPVVLTVDGDKVKSWLEKGAQPTETVKALLVKNGVIGK